MKDDFNLEREKALLGLVLLITIFIIIVLAGCGAYERRDCYASGDSCGGTKVQAPAPSPIPGPPGPAGRDGAAGAPGRDGINGRDGAVGPAGADGQTGAPGPQGIPGPQGQPGQDGADGAPGAAGPQGPAGASGTSCTVAPAANGAVISCGDGTSVVLLNGVDGADGRDAVPSPYAVSELIDPCGKQGQFDELLLRLEDGTLIGHYSHGDKQFLVSLTPGSYVTTDGTNCHFTVDNNLEVSW